MPFSRAYSINAGNGVIERSCAKRSRSSVQAGSYRRLPSLFWATTPYAGGLFSPASSASIVAAREYASLPLRRSVSPLEGKQLSGDEKPCVPQASRAWSREVCAMPKSMRRTHPVESSKMLLGFTSWWITPTRSSVSAVARKAMTGDMVESVSSTVMPLPVRRRCFARVSPSSHSSTIQLFSWAPTACGMHTVPCARALGSTRKFENFFNERHSSRHSSPFSNTFTAMGVPLGVCALKIVACPPWLTAFSNARFCGV